MSYSAYVAIQTGNDEYTVHFSHNGGYEAQLYDILEDNKDQLLSGSYQGLGTINLLPEIEQMNDKYGDRDNVEMTASDEAIEPQPFATELPKKAIGVPLDFADTELLYVVEEGSPVQLYFPAWLNPNVIEPLRKNMVIKVYRSDSILDNPSADPSNIDADPLRTIDADWLTGSEYLEDTITERIIREQHANIYALCNKTLDQLDDNDESGSLDETHFAIQTHSHDVLIETISDPTNWLPRTSGLGVFIELGDKTRREIELDVAEKRFNIGAELASFRREKSDEEFRLSQAELLIKLYQEYGSKIASFSPPPFGSIIEAFDVVDVNMDMAKNLSRKL